MKFVSRKGIDRTGVKKQIPAEMSRGWEELSEAPHSGSYQEPTGSPDKDKLLFKLRTQCGR